jgi:hypothetical protein
VTNGSTPTEKKYLLHIRKQFADHNTHITISKGGVQVTNKLSDLDFANISGSELNNLQETEKELNKNGKDGVYLLALTKKGKG